MLGNIYSGKTIFILAAAALAVSSIGLVTLITTTLRRLEVSVTAVRIGPQGIEGTVSDAGEYKVMNPPAFVAVARSEGSQICVASFLKTATDSVCLVHKEAEGWRIKVVGYAHCRVHCFKIEVR